MLAGQTEIESKSACMVLLNGGILRRREAVGGFFEGSLALTTILLPVLPSRNTESENLTESPQELSV